MVAPVPAKSFPSIFYVTNNPLPSLTEDWIRLRTTPGVVLEIGCASGHNLEPYLAAGWRALALEPNPGLAAVARAKGIEVTEGFGDALATTPQDCDVVILRHVLEHDYQPRTLLHRAIGRLKPGGVAYIEVPTLDVPSMHLFHRHWVSLEFPIHLTFLLPRQVVMLVRQEGLDVTQARYGRFAATGINSVLRAFPNAANASGLGRILLLSVGGMASVAELLTSSVLGGGEFYFVVAGRSRTS
jgi:SAM-dependent methyltransferase